MSTSSPERVPEPKRRVGVPDRRWVGRGAESFGRARPAEAGGEGFWRGVLAGAIGAFAVGFVLLGLWFRSQDGAPYRYMLGERARSALDAQLLAPEISGEAEAPSGERVWRESPPARDGITVYPASGPASAAGAGAAPARGPRPSYQLYGRPVLRSSPPASSSSPEPEDVGATAPAARPSAVAPPEPAGAALGGWAGGGTAPGSSAELPSRASKPRPSSSGRGMQQPERDLGIDELVDTHRRNRRVIGRAGSLLRSFGGE